MSDKLMLPVLCPVCSTHFCPIADPCLNAMVVEWHRLTADNAALVEALEFYADEESWKGVGMGISKAEAYDQGYIALTALEKR